MDVPLRRTALIRKGTRRVHDVAGVRRSQHRCGVPEVPVSKAQSNAIMEATHPR